MTLRNWLFLSPIVAISLVGCSGGTRRDKVAPKVVLAKPSADGGGGAAAGGSSTGGGDKPAVAVKVDGWGTIKGKIVWDGAVPTMKMINDPKDAAHCQQKGPFPEEQIVVDPKTKGLRDVYVFLKSAKAIHPDLPQDKAATTKAYEDQFQKDNGVALKDLAGAVKAGKKKLSEVKAPGILDQVLCKYVPHAVALREGQSFLVLNPEPIAHNVKISSTEASNENNKNMPPNTFETIKLAAGSRPNGLECSIHPWMKGMVMVLPHPYFAVSKEDGSFEIKNVPAGENVIMVMHGSTLIDPATGGKGTPKGTSVNVPVNGEVALNGGEIKVKSI